MLVGHPLHRQWQPCLRHPFRDFAVATGPICQRNGISSFASEAVIVSRNLRASITRWQAEHGYRKTGFLNAVQHTALLEESGSEIEQSKSEYPDHHHSRGHAHRHRGIGGPIGAVGGAIGGLFRR
jgi:hypothetical protein